MSKSTEKLKSNQSGVATVEAAIIIVVFLALIFGIIEFALLIFNASSLVEATRAGSRYLIVNEPVVDPATLGDCNSPVTVNCGSDGNCGGVLAEMRKFYPPLTADNLQITYRCSSTGYEESYFYIYEVELQLVNVQYKFITPGILGIDGTITLPDFKSTKMSEDLETVPAAS